MAVTVKAVGDFNFLNVLIVCEEGSNHRYVKKPGDDFEGEPQEVIDSRDKHHTPEIITAYNKWVAEEEKAFAPTGPRRVGKPREFLELFSETEQTAFFTAEATNVTLRLWWAKASTGDFSLDHPSVPPGLAALVQLGILTQERSAEILATDFDAA